MPKSRFTWILLLVGSLLLGTAWIVESRAEVGSAALPAVAAEAPLAGHLAPDFTLTTTLGEEFALNDYRGRPIVLNFWATWCPPCRAEIPHFQAASVKYNGQVTIAGVDDGEVLSTVVPFARELGMTYLIPLDTESVVSRRYQVNSLPSTFFIDRDGVIQHVQIGIVNQAILEDQIQRLLQ